MTAENWGCPDWRDASAYPDELELEQWRWQFMRRHPKFREIAARGKQVELEASYSEDQESFAYLIFEPIDEDRETLQRIFRIYSRTSPHPNESVLLTSEAPYWLGDLMPLPIAFGGIDPGLVDIPYGLEIIDDDTREVNWDKTEKRRREAFEKHVGRLYKAIEKGSYSLVVFDHSKNLNKQIKKAKEALSKRHTTFRDQRKSFTLKIKEWPRHLRVIDAKDQGASHTEIAERFVDDGLVDEATLYKVTGNKTTEESRHRATVSQWHSQAVEVMEKSTIML